MDWKSLRRDRLEKAASFEPAKRRAGLLWVTLDRVGDRWERFISLSLWEKSLIIGTGVLLAILTPFAAFAIAGGDDSSPALIATSPTTAIVVDAEPSATPSPRPSSTPKPVPSTATPIETPRPIRENCDVLLAADDGSAEELLWFVDNCDLETDTPIPTETPTNDGPGPSNPPTPVPPTSTPQPEPSISLSQAASLAAGWIRSNAAYAELNLSASSCTPQASGSGWRVACVGTTSGCAGAACELTIWVCVTNAGARQC